ncbi:MAG TPA: sugar phosphate isomerase/epimerase [Terriglobia bacterium]|nr:sugar phosphate isomerase/epimerase [Terriglobia bacterium]
MSAYAWGKIGAQARAERLHFGVQTNAWGVPIRNYDELLRILDDLARLRYTGFGTNVRTLEPYFSQAAKCGKDFETRHVRLIALYNAATLYPRARISTEIERLRPVASASAQMGAKHIIVGTAKLPRPGGKLDLHAAHIWADGLNQLGKAVKSEGIKLCCHNHRLEFEGHPTEMSFLLRDTDPDLVWINFDVGHPLGLIKPAVFSAEHFRRIAIYHLKDSKIEASGKIVNVAMGTGEVDVKGVVAPLLENSWDGWLEIEEDGNYPKPLPHREQVLRHDRKYLKEITGV